ncbi:MAG: peptidylprolyl isomerase [Thermodesulfobacteriota bacterium]
MAQGVKGNEVKMKRVILMFSLFFFVGCGPISSSEAVVDRIAAIVNQEIITLSEVEKWAMPYQEEIQAKDRLEREKQVRELHRKVLEKLIEEKLIDQEVKKAGVKVTSKEIDGALEEVKRRNAATQEELERALAQEGLTLEVYRKEIEKKLLRMKLVHWAVKVESPAGEKEWRDFYQKNIGRYRVNESYRPGQILFLVPKEAKEGEIREIRRRCEKVLEKIKGGEDFGEMAILFSEDISAKDRGDLGFFKKGDLLVELEKEALRLRVGEVSGIIRTSLGFHIIKLLDRRGEAPLPFEEVKEKVKADFQAKETEKSYLQFLSTLREKSVIEIKL